MELGIRFTPTLSLMSYPLPGINLSEVEFLLYNGTMRPTNLFSRVLIRTIKPDK